MAEIIRRETSKEVEQPKKEFPKQFVMIKNFRGGLSVELQPYDFSTPPRTIQFKYDMESQYIPVKMALGVFVTPNALNQMIKGYFTFDNLQVLIEMAEQMDLFVPEEIKSPIVTLKEIRTALLKNDTKLIERMMFNASTKLIKDLIGTAQKVYPSLNNNVIEYIQKKYKVSIAPVNLKDE